MSGNDSMVAAFALPLFGTHFFLFYRLFSSLDDQQRQLLTGPRWITTLNVLTVGVAFVVLAKFESQLGRLIAVAAGSAVLTITWAVRLRYQRRCGLAPSVLSRLHRLDLLGALGVALVAIAYVLSGT